MLKKRRQEAACDVAVPIDAGGEHGAAVLTKPSRIIGAAAEERDAVGCATDNHDEHLRFSFAEKISPLAKITGSMPANSGVAAPSSAREEAVAILPDPIAPIVEQIRNGLFERNLWNPA